MQRYEELDSMRGIAALAVIISHGLAIFALPSNLLDITPLYFFWASHEAVIFFFVLSGFVLSFPFLSKKVNYADYLIKRFFRIYAPYLIAILFTFFMFYLFASQGKLTGLGAWVETKWNKSLSVSGFINHITLLGNYDTTTYNPVIWSLIHELRISIVFPVIIFMLIKYPQKYTVLLGVSLSIIGCLNRVFEFQTSYGYLTSMFDSLHYILMFITGAILAKNKDYLLDKYSNLQFKYKLSLLLIGFAVYLYSRLIYLIPSFLGYKDLSTFMYGITDWGISLGSAFLIIAVLGSKKISSLMNTKIFIINGRLSYSTYLYHTTVLLTLFSLFNGTLNNWLTFGISLLLTFLIAYCSWKFIELPSIKLGKQLTTKTNKVRIKRVG